LPESDYVIALDKGGRLIEQGTFSNLRSGAGYVESLDISSHFDESDSSLSESSDSPSEPKRSESQPQRQKDEAEPPSDRSVFMYYFKAIRGHNNTMQVFLIVTQGVIASFRCKNPVLQVCFSC
jgi:hypothetical protein